MKSNFIKRNRAFALLLALVMVGSLFGGTVAFSSQPGQTEVTISHVGINYQRDTNGFEIAAPNTARLPAMAAPEIPGFELTETVDELTQIHSQNRYWYLQGRPTGGVYPSDNITRAEGIAVTARTFGWRLGPDYYGNNRLTESTFTDVTPDRWFYPYVYTAYAADLLFETSGNQLHPEDDLTRAEAFQLLVNNAVAYELVNLNQDDQTPDDGEEADAPDDEDDLLDPETFNIETDFEALADALDIEVIPAYEIFLDIDQDDPLLPIFTAAATLGLVEGDERHQLNPDANITRAEVAAIYNRMLGRTAELEELPVGINPYNDLTESHWAYVYLILASADHNVIDLFGTAFNDGEAYFVLQRFIDEYGYELADPIITELTASPAPQDINMYTYWGSIREVTHVYADAEAPMLTATKTSTSSIVRVGERTTYVIPVTNDAAANVPARNVTITDTIPAGLQFVTGTLTVGGYRQTPALSEDGQTLTIEVGTIWPGETVTVMFQATALPEGAAQTWHNVAIIESDNHPDIEVEDDTGVEIPHDDTELPLFDVTKTATPGEVRVGERVTWTIRTHVYEDSPVPLRDAVATDVIPAGFQFILGSLAVDGVSQTVTATDNTISVPIGTINPGETVYVTLQATALQSGMGQTWRNLAIIGGSNTPDRETECGGVRIPQEEFNLNGNKRINSTELRIGGIYTYTITMTHPANAGGNVYRGRWQDQLDTSALIFINDSVRVNGTRVPAGEFSYNRGLLTVDVGTVAPGETVILTFDVQVRSDAAGRTLANAATFTGSTTPGGDRDVELRVVERVPVRDRQPGDRETSDIRLWLFQGDTHGMFDPDRPITRAEMAVVAHRSLAAPGVPNWINMPTDVFQPGGDGLRWFAESVMYFVNNGVLSVSGGLVRPDDEASSADIMALLNYMNRNDVFDTDRFAQITAVITGQPYVRRIVMAQVICLLQGRDRNPTIDGLTYTTFPDVPYGSPFFWLVSGMTADHGFTRDSAGNETWYTP